MSLFQKFCSSECYKSSKYYSSQLSSLPLWARDTQPAKVKLFTSVSRYVMSHWIDRGHSVKNANLSPPQQTLQTESINVSITEHPSPPQLGVVQQAPDTLDLEGQCEAIQVWLTLEVVGSSPLIRALFLQHPKLSSVGKLLHALNSWCTPNTWHLLTSGELQVYS